MSKYPEKTRMGLNVPWGYEEHPDDPDRFIPIEDMLDAYYEAIEHQKNGCSWRQVAKWLSMETGVSITPGGLYMKVRNERKEKNRARGKKAWKARFEKSNSAASSAEEEGNTADS